MEVVKIESESVVGPSEYVLNMIKKPFPAFIATI
jgi:hypothetical protein